VSITTTHTPRTLTQIIFTRLRLLTAHTDAVLRQDRLSGEIIDGARHDEGDYSPVSLQSPSSLPSVSQSLSSA